MLSGFLLPIILGSLLLWSSWDAGQGRKQWQFDSEEWKQAPGSGSRIRLKMIDDLRNNYRLKGQSRQEIVELLSSPTDTEYFENYDMVYLLGKEDNPYGVDSRWLVVKFDEGTVSKVEVQTD